MNNNDTDIVCLQETWYSKQDLATLHTLHKTFHGIGAVTVDDTDGLCRGHIPGGVAIMWRSSLDKNGTPLNFYTDWLTGIQISVGNFPGNKSISQDGGKYREILGNMESMFLPGYLTLDAMTICSWVIWLIINNTLSILSIS